MTRLVRSLVTALTVVFAAESFSTRASAAADGPAPSAETKLRSALAPKVKEIAEQLKAGPRPPELAKPRVLGPDNKPEGGDLGLLRLIVAVLRENQIDVKEEARFGLTVQFKVGDVADPNEPGHAVAGVLIVMMLSHGGREVGTRLRVDVPGVDVIAKLSTFAVDATSAQTTDDVDRVVLAAAAGRSAAVVAADGTARASAESPFGLALVVDGKPRKLEPSGEGVVASLPGGKPFSVRLRNDAAFEVAVSLALDGIDAFAFSEGGGPGRPRGPSHFLIPPGQTLDVPGWYLAADRADRFLVTELPKAAATELGKIDAERLHTVSATFRAAFETTPPPGEPVQPLGNAQDYGIGRGAPSPFRTQAVSKKLGAERAIVPLRYQRDRSE